MSFDEYFGLNDGMSALDQLIAFLVGVAPQATQRVYMDLQAADPARRRGPSAGLACQLCSGVTTVEVLKILLGRPHLHPAPRYYQFDAYRQVLRRGYLWWGGRNPLQRLKRWLVRRQFARWDGTRRSMRIAAPPRPLPACPAGEGGRPLFPLSRGSRMMRNLLQPPDSECPDCGRSDVAWGRAIGSGRSRLAAARLLSRLTRRIVDLRLRCRACGRRFSHLHALPRVVVGYHGCQRDFARALVAGRASIEAWKASQNEYDWLGEGIYFWEHAPGRAWQWAREHYGADGAVVAAEIFLGRCLDLGDVEFADLLRSTYEGTLRMYQTLGRTMPRNTGRDLKFRKLDRLVIDRSTATTDPPGGVYYQTVRCPFEEGDPIFEGAMFKAQSHVQIAVRDKSCIASRIFLLESEGG